ncbi:hypothetical protein B0H11DRAFT_2218459 [Mycena galericulata]|nr:hypothetical protein B0H11DRAFT_2218459 [Mycena galericulata]
MGGVVLEKLTQIWQFASSTSPSRPYTPHACYAPRSLHYNYYYYHYYDYDYDYPAAVLAMAHPTSVGLYRCLPPWHPDNPSETRHGSKKFYLATGPDLGDSAGVYTSWNSANRVISGSRGATAPTFSKWDDLVIVWQVSCAQGEHGHPSGPDSPRLAGMLLAPTPAPPGHRTGTLTVGGRVYENVPISTHTSSPRRRGGNSLPAPASPTKRTSMPQPPARGAAPTPSPSPFARSSAATGTWSSTSAAAGATATSASPARGGLASRTYGIRWGDEGAVVTSFDQAIGLYDKLEGEGLRPRMLISRSSVEAVSFAEGFSLMFPDPEAQRRHEWMEAQEAAAEDTQWVPTAGEQEEMRALRERLAQLESRFT